jgi:hypothetical protein
MKLRGLYLASLILLTLGSVLAIVLLALTMQSNVSEFAIYDDIQRNFIQNPISKIKVQDSECTLPLTPLLQLEWPGIRPYCSCWLYSYSGRCTNKQLSRGCKTNGDVSPSVLGKYKGIYMCAERLGVNYDSIVEEPADGKCSEGMKKCGTSTEGWILCFPAHTDCPINDLIFSTTHKPELTKNDYKEIQIKYPESHSNIFSFASEILAKPSWYIYYSNEQTSKPIVVQFGVGWNNLICFNPRQKLTPIDQYKYLNDHDAYKKECSAIAHQRFDTRYNYLDTYNKYNLWVENGYIPIMDKLQDFDAQSLNYNVDIFKRGYLHLDSKCLFDGETQIYELKSQVIDVLSFKDPSFNKKAYFVSCFFFLGLAIFFAVISIFSTCDSKKTTWCQWTMGLISASMIAVVIFLVLSIQSKGSIRNDHISKLYPKNCGDKLTNLVIQTSYNNSHREAIFFLVIVVVLGLGVVAHFVYLVLKPCEKKPKSHDDTKDYDRIYHESPAKVHHLDDHPYAAFDEKHDVGLFD